MLDFVCRYQEADDAPQSLIYRAPHRRSNERDYPRIGESKSSIVFILMTV